MTIRVSPIHPKIRFMLHMSTGGHCWYCGAEVSLTAKRFAPDCYQVDHIVSVQNGGTDDIENFHPACLQCNRRKHRNTIEAFRITYFGGRLFWGDRVANRKHMQPLNPTVSTWPEPYRSLYRERNA